MERLSEERSSRQQLWEKSTHRLGIESSQQVEQKKLRKIVVSEREIPQGIDYTMDDEDNRKPSILSRIKKSH